MGIDAAKLLQYQLEVNGRILVDSYKLPFLNVHKASSSNSKENEQVDCDRRKKNKQNIADTPNTRNIQR